MSTENVAGAWSKLDNLELTPAASEALDLNADLFKRQVLHELSRTHSRRGYRVRVSDVQLAADQVVAKGPRSAKVVRLLTRLALILAGIALFVQTLISLTGVGQSWVVSAAALLTGISTGTATVLVVQEFRGRRKETTASRGFLWEIQALEWSARQAVKQVLGREAENASLARVLSALEILEVWTPEDSQVFRRLLFLRNSLVHEDSRILSSDDIGFGLSQASRLSDLIRRGEKALKTETGQGLLGSSSWLRRAASTYEERVAHALREASFEVVGAQGDYGYDILTETPSGSLAIVIKHRDGGTLEIGDLRQFAPGRLPNMTAALVTNVPLSDSATNYLRSLESLANRVIVVPWLEEESDSKLVERILRAAEYSRVESD
jgi:uncharacterized protein YoaH (UPF0181 family)